MNEEAPSSGGGGLLAILGLLLAATLILPLFLIVLLGGAQADQDTASLCTPDGSAPALTVSVDLNALPDVPGYTKEQIGVAAVIMQVGQQLGFGERGQMIAIMTARQESTLGANKNSFTPDENHDAGVFQQRILPGWYGTLDQVNDLTYGATAFYMGHDIGPESPPGAAGPPNYHLPGLKDIKGWESMSPTQAAQAVQGSGYPDAYAQWESDARMIMGALSGKAVPTTAADPSAAPAASTGAPCAGSGGDAAAAQAATSLDDLPRFPVPSGCTDQTPVFGDYGIGGLNGNVPDSALCAIAGGSHRGQARAVAAFTAMNNDFRARFGHDIGINSDYRTISDQQSMKARKGRLAATPGYSNHGYGLALDLQATSTEYAWINANGPKYGWWHPLWARPSGDKPEPWHFEYGTWLLEDRYKGMDPAQIPQG